MNKTKLKKRTKSVRTRSLSSISRKRKHQTQTLRDSMTTSRTKLTCRRRAGAPRVPLGATSSGDSVTYIGSYQQNKIYPIVDLTNSDSTEGLDQKRCATLNTIVEPHITDAPRANNNINKKSTTELNNLTEVHKAETNVHNILPKSSNTDINANLAHDDSFVLNEVLDMENALQSQFLDNVQIDQLPFHLSTENLIQIYDVSCKDNFD